jgi:DNA polymerase-1
MRKNMKRTTTIPMETTAKGLEGTQFHFVNNTETASQFLTWLGERRPNGAIAIDIETGELPGNHTKDALSPWHGRIRLAQIGDGMQGWAIPWDEWKGVFYEAAENYVGPMIFHNVAFEAKWFALQSRWNMPWHQVHDTMIMSQVLRPDEGATLKGLTSTYVDSGAANMQSALDRAMVANGWTWGTIPIDYPDYWIYGALDTVLTTRLWELDYAKCQPGAQFSTAYELEMGVRRIATQMELTGLHVDLEYSEKKRDELVAYSDGVKDYMQRTFDTSITSPPQLVRLFEDKLGATITERTARGGKSVNQDQLDLFAASSSPDVKAVAQLIVDQRRAAKLATSYFDNFLRDNVDGVVHPSIKTMGARTGRMSITNPALQTLPSGESTVRRAFIPRDDMSGIISSDLDQVEFRLAACLSEDAALIQLFLDADAGGGDVFTSIMQEVYADPTLQKSDSRRGLIKSMIYGKLYGAGTAKQAMTAGVPLAQMETVVSSFDRNYPGIKLLQKKIEALAQDRLSNEGRGYVTTRTGRQIPGDSDKLYSLVNYLIQGTAAELFKQNLIKMDQAGLTDYLVVPVHDEIVLQAPLNEAPEVMAAVQECMTTREGWAVPLTSGVEGPFANWGAKYEK